MRVTKEPEVRKQEILDTASNCSGKMVMKKPRLQI